MPNDSEPTDLARHQQEPTFRQRGVDRATMNTCIHSLHLVHARKRAHISSHQRSIGHRTHRESGSVISRGCCLQRRSRPCEMERGFQHLDRWRVVSTARKYRAVAGPPTIGPPHYEPAGLISEARCGTRSDRALLHARTLTLHHVLRAFGNGADPRLTPTCRNT